MYKYKKKSRWKYRKILHYNSSIYLSQKYFSSLSDIYGQKNEFYIYRIYDQFLVGRDITHLGIV